MLLEIGDQRVAIGGARSIGAERVEFQRHVLGEAELLPQACREQDHFGIDIWPLKAKGFHADLMELAVTAFLWRSEEHTSELQSRGQLVCRLLLEKIKKNYYMIARCKAEQVGIRGTEQRY